MRRTLLTLIFLYLLFPSLLTAESPLLPDGLYLYTHTRTNRFPDLDKQTRDSGLNVSVETRELYESVLIKVKEGSWKDPAVSLILKADLAGGISSPDNDSIKGEVENGFVLSWRGERDHFGQRVTMETRAQLIPITSEMRADASLDGLYFLKEEVMEREMICTISEGVMDFQPVKRESWDDLAGEGSVLVQPDGSFSTKLELTTRTETSFFIDAEKKKKESVTSDSSTFVEQWGLAGVQGLQFNYYSHTSSAVEDSQKPQKRLFAGVKIADVEQGETILAPNDTENTPRHPRWFLNPPEREGFLTGTGHKTSDDPLEAVRAAETTAAANLALQFQVRIKASLEEKISDKDPNLYQMVMDQTAHLSLNYTIEKSVYQKRTGTAYVLVSCPEETAFASVLDLMKSYGLEP